MCTTVEQAFEPDKPWNEQLFESLGRRDLPALPGANSADSAYLPGTNSADSAYLHGKQRRLGVLRGANSADSRSP
jgi:hypothetical protein